MSELSSALYFGQAQCYVERSVTGDTGAMVAKLEDMEMLGISGSDIMLFEKKVIETDLGTTIERWVGFSTKGNTRKLILDEQARGILPLLQLGSTGKEVTQ